MSAPQQHSHMFAVGVRMLAQLAAMLYAVAYGGVLYALGSHEDAKSAFVIGLIVAWAVAPDKDDKAAYIAFQATRTRPPTP